MRDVTPRGFVVGNGGTCGVLMACAGHKGILCFKFGPRELAIQAERGRQDWQAHTLQAGRHHGSHREDTLNDLVPGCSFAGLRAAPGGGSSGRGVGSGEGSAGGCGTVAMQQALERAKGMLTGMETRHEGSPGDGGRHARATVGAREWGSRGASPSDCRPQKMERAEARRFFRIREVTERKGADDGAGTGGEWARVTHGEELAGTTDRETGGQRGGARGEPSGGQRCRPDGRYDSATSRGIDPPERRDLSSQGNREGRRETERADWHHGERANRHRDEHRSEHHGERTNRHRGEDAEPYTPGAATTNQLGHGGSERRGVKRPRPSRGAGGGTRWPCEGRQEEEAYTDDHSSDYEEGELHRAHVPQEPDAYPRSERPRHRPSRVHTPPRSPHSLEHGKHTARSNRSPRRGSAPCGGERPSPPRRAGHPSFQCDHVAFRPRSDGVHSPGLRQGGWEKRRRDQENTQGEGRQPGGARSQWEHKGAADQSAAPYREAPRQPISWTDYALEGDIEEDMVHPQCGDLGGSSLSPVSVDSPKHPTSPTVLLSADDFESDEECVIIE
ncbi:hypothetical protein CYMTET_12858 [Cymbomonas tetramitiformis]|uniref:Uncharacterized protein n=1 Tax=Cymbomonas tetramitiformis TaxID=36881 RepID=A0AAE0GJL0_9CHLO|nr:hypothetical protein CYMTET_12858 [Cymbomonas tetramitiformis]